MFPLEGSSGMPSVSNWLAFAYEKEVGTVCRVCGVRNTITKPVIVIATPNLTYALSADLTKEKPLRIVTALCLPCYDRLIKEMFGHELLPEVKFPRLATLQLREQYDEGLVYCQLEAWQIERAFKLIGLAVKRLQKEDLEVREVESTIESYERPRERGNPTGGFKS